ncbi:MAG: hypothetical protein ABJI44_00220 [Marinomonas sp.]|uniref:hypothetical protein n=1 Tax=Qipengyuania citrea TaxID=225971 RepID=UPI003265BBD4
MKKKKTQKRYIQADYDAVARLRGEGYTRAEIALLLNMELEAVKHLIRYAPVRKRPRIRV